MFSSMNSLKQVNEPGITDPRSGSVCKEASRTSRGLA